MRFAREEDVAEALRLACVLADAATGSGSHCGKTFDGLFCWPETRAGQWARQPCDGTLLRAVNKDGIAKKFCTENGTWFAKDNDTRPWTDLTDCSKFYVEINETEKFQNVYDEWIPSIKITAYVGYALSMACVIFALVIFISIRSLHCERNKLHIHFFISFLGRGLMYLLKDALFEKGTALRHQLRYENGQPKFTDESYSSVCKTIISVRFCFIVANFTFMLMEGMYLHNLMFLNLFSDNHGTKIYCIVGWALPVVFVVVWAILKMFFDDIGCWTERGNVYIDLFINFPIGASVTLNFVLFLVIIRVLVVKLNFSAAFIQQRRTRYRKLVKSTLILILLFGMPYVISLVLSFFIEPEKGDTNQMLEIVWLFFDQTFAAFQGIFATSVYCIFNGEVQSEIRRKYCSMRDRNTKEFRRSRTISATQQFSMHAMDEQYENAQFFSTNLKDGKTKTETTES